MINIITVNENFLKLQNNYLFSNISKKVDKYKQKNPNKKIIKLGIGDVTLPIPKVITNAMKNAANDLENKNTFKGYGPEQGYEFLRVKIALNEYATRNIKIDKDEIFVSDGAKCDTGNIIDIFSKDNKIAITDPVYPVYLDTNVMAGRSGDFDESSQKYENIIYMPCKMENNFIPDFPEEVPDIIYICSPNNPTGTVLNKEQLQKWVDYAKENKSIIFFDAAYEAFISEKDIPHSIYEIEGAKDVAIEFKSFSKTAGFTGIRCGYTVVPANLYGYTKSGNKVSIKDLWYRRQCTKFNGVSYITQKGAEAVYSEEGKLQIIQNINYYKENAKIITETFKNKEFDVFGGKNSPYIWINLKNDIKSWDFFDILLEKEGIVGTPGAGFGPSGEGYFRLTSFGDRENIIQAMERIKLSDNI